MADEIQPSAYSKKFMSKLWTGDILGLIIVAFPDKLG
jgi:hypothetical protein